MNMLPPKKRKENRRSQEEHQSSDETSSYNSESSHTQEENESVSPISTSPVRQPSPPSSLTCAPSLIPLTQSVPMRTIVDSPSPDSLAESPPLSTRIKDEPEEILEVDDHNRSSEADSGVEDIKTEDDHSGHSDEDNGLKISNLDRKMHDQSQAQAMMHMMALHQQAQRVCRPIANRVGALPFPLFLPSPFFSPTFGFPPYPRVLLPPPAIPPQLPPTSPPPLAPNRPFSPRMRNLSPHRGNTIQDGNSPTRRMTRDEKLAAQLGMSPRDIERVVSMPMDEFQDYAHQKSLTEDQMNILRDIRRRGKNKVAAQNCRKRKIDQIDELQGKVEEMKKEIEKNEKIYKENRLEQPTWFENFGKLKQELEEHNREYLGCSQHPILTKACLGTKGCEITVKLIRS
eukprot:TRINITY_DN19139_c0_g1_i2.p1 TRINITY_DN19139_c0_g1~~TRINITY_DN19139_c0_g1_i2.p1  ORF type:complete len:400 (-),score=79.47 TRINITY_DN19139_c0_g1_i2:486-1685(-)